MKRDTDRIRMPDARRLADRLLAAGTMFALALMVPVPAAAQGTVPAPEDGKPSVHQIPKVPLTIDGKRVEAMEIQRYNGQTLYMAAVPDAGTGAQDSLHAFTSPGEFEKFVRAQGGPENLLGKTVHNADPKTPGRGWRVLSAVTQTAGVSPQAFPTTGSAIYEDMGFQGSGLWLEQGWGFPDLTGVSLGCLFCSWNDEASSSWTAGASYQILYEHINYTGSLLWTPPATSRTYLEGLGWNDRVSSFISY